MKKFLFFILLSLSCSLFADRLIKDQNGRDVVLPDEVNRIVVLQHQSLNVLVQLDALSKVVGVLESWEKNLGKNYVRLAPALKDMPTPGDLKSINYEQILALKPDVVIVANYIPKEFIDKLSELKIPVVAMSFFKDNINAQNSLNPEFKNFSDEINAYTNGLYEGILLLGSIANKEQNAQNLVDYVKEKQKLLKTYTDKIKGAKTRLYMANPDFNTYGSGKYTSIIFARAGGENVAAKDIKGYKQVGPENLISWDPDVIFVQERYPQVIDELKQNELLKGLKAIKNDKVYLMPEYAKAWGFPTPEAMALGEFWVLKKLYPELGKDIDLDAFVDEYYLKFYRVKN
ncbi:hypothetical protein CR66_04645 [Campylobacter mucosalis]|uniref:ABC transporter substrate-binding protein n=1 Tax=Campylobacter mucosalis TaxID=202 RepID=UPI0004D8A2A3|nr:ABC transporter substrate-binding protein [Campylobacter mucosalis]KEA46058.1 hypothetical protein CR66_04645 [Campylobacter mucosalis]QKF63519.1 ABC transporter, periplasmic substrate-binding protein [Campylobacter mucosalis]